jgi:hypothetical protein
MSAERELAYTRLMAPTENSSYASLKQLNGLLRTPGSFEDSVLQVLRSVPYSMQKPGVVTFP